MFSAFVLEFDLLGDGDAVLGDRGAAPGLVEDRVATRGPRVLLTARASFSTPARRDWRASVSKTMFLGWHRELLRLGMSRLEPLYGAWITYSTGVLGNVVPPEAVSPCVWGPGNAQIGRGVTR
jgi:hypothetical protein